MKNFKKNPSFFLTENRKETLLLVDMLRNEAYMSIAQATDEAPSRAMRIKQVSQVMCKQLSITLAAQ